MLLTRKQFSEITSWTKQKLWLFCYETILKYGKVSGIGILLKLRRNLQEGMADYSKGKSDIDARQFRCIWMTRMIEKWCSESYLDWAKCEILKNRPELVSNPQKLNGLANEKWEQYVRKNSY